MALGWLNVLELGARIARPFIQLGITLGRTLSEIGTVLTRSGARIEASSARRIYEAERAERAAASDLVVGGLDRLPSRDEFSEAVTRQRREFAWRIRLGYVDPRSGESTVRYLTISTDELLSPQEAIDEALDELADEYGVSGEFVVESTVVSATRAAPGRRL